MDRAAATSKFCSDLKCIEVYSTGSHQVYISQLGVLQFCQTHDSFREGLFYMNQVIGPTETGLRSPSEAIIMNLITMRSSFGVLHFRDSEPSAV